MAGIDRAAKNRDLLPVFLQSIFDAWFFDKVDWALTKNNRS